MSLTDEERRIIVGLEMEKSRRIFNQIDELARLGFWDNIANRLYYALFHAVSALLIKDGHSVNTHKGIVASIGQYYVKKGLLTSDDARLYSQLMTIREKGDYNCSYDIEEEDLKPKIARAKALIEKVADLVDAE